MMTNKLFPGEGFFGEEQVHCQRKEMYLCACSLSKKAQKNWCRVRHSGANTRGLIDADGILKANTAKEERGKFLGTNLQCHNSPYLLDAWWNTPPLARRFEGDGPPGRRKEALVTHRYRFNADELPAQHKNHEASNVPRKGVHEGHRSSIRGASIAMLFKKSHSKV